MAKSYSITTVYKVNISIDVLEDAIDPDTGLYHIGKLHLSAKANNTHATAGIESNTFLGSGQSTPYTPQETYTAINGYSNLNTMLATKLKDIYNDIIDVDISA